MSTLARRIAEYAFSLEFSKLSGEVIEEAKKRILDSLAVMAGAFRATPPSIARKVVLLSCPGSYSASLYGLARRAPVDHVSFYNGCLVRYLDFNDTYLSREALHPSDNIPALMAVAEAEDAGGKELIEGMMAAYEVACRLADASSIRARGWDHVTYIAISSAVGAAKVMGLDTKGIEQAVNLAATPNIALRQTRAGELSMWKGCAAANAARNGVFAALLAKHGMTGPAPVFEGEMGFWNQVSGSFNLDRMGGEDGEQYKILQTSIKYYPVEYHAMSAVEAALQVRDRLGGLRSDDISETRIKTFQVCHNIIVKDPEKWNPKTRETADHSLPYIVSAALLDGKVWLETFEEKRILADDVREVMRRMSVEVDEEHDKGYPDGVPNTIAVRTRDGRSAEVGVKYPRGHYRNPLTREKVEEKFRMLASGILPEDRRKLIASRVWGLEGLTNLKGLTSLLVAEAT